jgi:predicted Zn finger-like uncharacterized protein
MILTCPECETRFVVPDNAIQDDGRKVRCAQCSHVWHQKPVKQSPQAEKTKEDNNVAEEPVIIRETAQGEWRETSSRNILAILKHDLTEGKKVVLSSFATVLIVFLIIQLFSSSPLIIGQGLAFHNIIIEREQGILIISGEIVNSMDDVRGVPVIEITSLYEDTEGDSFILTPSKQILESGEKIDFNYSLEAVDDYITDLRIRFKIPNGNQDGAG